jgi:hypothetical protein
MRKWMKTRTALIFCVDKELRDNNATGCDDVPEDLLKQLEEDGLRLVTQLINNI